MARLQDLPPELLQCIFSFIHELKSLCLLTSVCKGFRKNAEPSLYHTFHIPQSPGNRTPLRFTRTLLERPPLGKHVKTLSLGIWPCGFPDRLSKDGWTIEDHVDFEKIVRTLGISTSEPWTAGEQYGRKRSYNDTTGYILLVALLSLVSGLQELHFQGNHGLSVPYSLIQRLAEVSWTTSYPARSFREAFGLLSVNDGGRLPLAQAQLPLSGPPFTTLAASQITETVDDRRLGLISLGTAVTKMKLDWSVFTEKALEELIGLPRTLKSFTYLAETKQERLGKNLSPGAVVDILYERHARSLKNLTIEIDDGYTGWQDATTRLYRSTCLCNFTNLTHLRVKQHMLLRVQLDMRR